MMTQEQFNSKIRQLVRRTELMQLARDGKLKLRQVDVKKCTVPEHTRVAHVRLIAPKGWKSRRTP